MSDNSPRKSPSRTSSHLPSPKGKGGPAPKPRAPDSKIKPKDDTDMTMHTDDDTKSTHDWRYGRGGSQRGAGPLRPSFGGGEPDVSENATPKKHVVRLTLTEAAEEIKRLRRLERQHTAQRKQYEEEARQYMEQATNLKQQLLDNERLHKEEKASLISMYENDASRLKGQLRAACDELRVLQETSLPLMEARKLTFKALRKGRALQYMAELYTNNTVLMSVKREALHRLLENAVGADHAVFRATHGFACGVQAYSDASLRLMRQEQLVLLAEIERLQTQIKNMQHRTENSRRERALHQESVLAGKEDTPWLPQQSRDVSLSGVSSHSVSGDTPSWQRLRTESHALAMPMSKEQINLKTKDVEQELARSKLRAISGVFCMGKTRLLAYAFRRLYAYSLSESIVQSMESARTKSSIALRKDAILTGSSLMTSFVRTTEKALMVRAFWLIFLNSKTQSYAMDIQQLNEQLKQAQQQAPISLENPTYSSSTCRACHAWSVLSSELNQTTGSADRPHNLRQRGEDSNGGFGIPPSQGGGIPLPVAYAPHYFRDLPSTQKRRNMYFTTAPPRVPQQSLTTTAQRVRDMALTQEMFYRPITAAEGWKVSGANGFGIGMEPVGTVIGSHATSQGNKVDAAQGTLHGTLLLPATTVSSQPMTAAERNDAYMEQLVRATDQRLKLQ